MMTQDTYRERRERLMERFGDRDVIFLRGNSAVRRNADIEYRFRQDSNVRYLTGIDFPDAALLLIPGEKKFILFAKEYSAAEQVWMGKTPSLEELGEQFGADEAYHISEARKVVGRYRQAAIHSLKGLSSPFCYRRKQLAGALAGMRLVKSPDEIGEVEGALEATAKAFEAIMRQARPGVNEQELEAIVEFMWRAHGDGNYAFPHIATINGATLHSDENTNTLEGGKLLLIDIGCEYNGYCSDITRTFPVNGKFTPEQAAIYDIVLRAKRECIGMIGPGVPYKEIHDHACRVIIQGLLDCGILKGDLDTILEKQAHKLFFMHSIGHWLGMDCHDCSDMEKEAKTYSVMLKQGALQPGNVITIEPGIYFNERILNDPENVEKYSGLVDFEKARDLMATVSGIRLEDDVLVTETGHRVLGPDIPEERDELEKIVGAGGFRFFE